jgi:DNA-binding transcriptional LysR family regulator
MELRQLEYFVAVAEEANFTRAAARVHISQSGVSAQIRQLERELGATLFDRSGRTATLTTAGALALEHARAALAAADAVQRSVDDVNDLIQGRLVVGMVTACTVTALFDALASFHAAHPGVEITLLEETSDQLTERVRAGTVDLALVGSAAEPPSDVEALPIVRERLVAAVPPGHPLARRSSVDLDAVLAHPVVCMPVGAGIRTAFDRACAARGLQPVVALQASAPDTVADLAHRGLGVAILSESMGAAYADRLRGRIIRDVELRAVLSVIWRPTESPALRELVVHTREAFAAPTRATAPTPRRRTRR